MLSSGTISVTQYIEAVNKGSGSFASLKNIIPVRDAGNNELIFVAGGQTVVFMVMIDEVRYSLKCYTVRNPYLRKHYDLIKNAVSEIVPSMILLEKEIAVEHYEGGITWEDVILYPWIEGRSLMDAIHQAVDEYDTGKLFDLTLSFISLARELISLPICHGDLKPQNIIVGESGEMKIIDFDMVQQKDDPLIENKVRTVWYQHPRFKDRNVAAYSIDDYAIAVIAVSLFALSLQPHLFYQYHNGENIIVDPRKISNNDNLSRELNSLLLYYPNYAALFDIVISKEYIYRDMAVLLENISGTVPLEAGSYFFLDEGNEIRRVVSKYGLYGFADAEGKLMVGCCYGDATAFCDGVAGVRLNNMWFIINSRGIKVSPRCYDRLQCSSSGLMPACINGKWGYLSAGDCSTVISFIFDYVYPYSEDTGLVCKNSKMFYLGTDGGILFENKLFDYARPFDKGLAIVGELTDEVMMYYVIDRCGKTVVKPTENKLLSIDGGIIYFRKDEDVEKMELNLLSK